MKKTILKSALLGLTAAAIALAPVAGRAQETKKDAPAEKKEAPAAAKSNRAIPFKGKIDAVDKVAKTIKVGERVFQITSDTIIKKAGKPATLDDAVVGEEIGGAYRAGEKNSMNAVSVRLGAKEAAGEKGEKAPAEKKVMKE
jgi:hypothetical protein